MTADPSTPPPSRWFLALGVAALLGFGLYIGLVCSIVAGGADSSGYLNSARLFAAGELRTPLRVVPELAPLAAATPPHFTPLGFVATAQPTELAPTYPTGLPLHFAPAARLLGWNVGPRLVLALGATFAVWLCYLLARELGLPRALAASGALILAAFPVFLFTSLQPLSDTLATTWCLAALWFALRARRGGTLPSALCGLALSLAVLVRPTNILLAPALLILLGFHFRRLAAFVAAGLPAALWFVWYNNYQYGGPFASGYGEVGAAFAARYFLPTAANFTLWLATLLPAALLLLPFAALAQPATRTRGLLALVVAFAAIAGAYACYEVSHEVWWCLRFILPVVPALILVALLGVEALARGPGARWPRAFRPACAAALALWAVVLSAARSPGLLVFHVPGYERIYADTAAAAKKLLPPEALVASFAFSGTLYFYTDFPVIRYDMMPRDDFHRYLSVARAARRPFCAVVYDFEEETLRKYHPGPWQHLGSIANVRFLQLE